jgi:hypothetical protein
MYLNHRPKGKSFATFFICLGKSQLRAKDMILVQRARSLLGLGFGPGLNPAMDAEAGVPPAEEGSTLPDRGDRADPVLLLEVDDPGWRRASRRPGFGSKFVDC